MTLAQFSLYRSQQRKHSRYTGRINQYSLRYIGRPISHMTLRYAVDRGRVWLYEHRYKSAPWLTAEAVSILDQVLRRQDCGLEYGSGRSTVWLAKRTNSMVSVESSRTWYERINHHLVTECISSVDYRYVPANERAEEDAYFMNYVCAMPDLKHKSLDYVLVDGLYRDACANFAAPLVKDGGILILDDAHWYIPHETTSPFATKSTLNSLWAEFIEFVSSWRLIWTSNGVSDTAIWFRTS